MQKSQTTDDRSRGATALDERVLAGAPTRRLTRDVIGVTAIKVALLAAIYGLFFWGASHRLPTDAVAHIAGIPSSTQFPIQAR